MSGLLMGLVYYYQFTPRQQKILLALADHGKDDGTSIHPSIETLAWKTGCDRRNVQKALRSLEEIGVLRPIAYASGGRGHATEYEMHLEVAPMRTSPPPSSGMKRIYNLLKGGDSATVSEQDDDVKGGDSATVSQNVHKGRRSTHIKGGDPRIKGGDLNVKGGAIAAPTNITISNNHQEETAHARAARMSPPLDEKMVNPEPDPEPEAEPPPLRGAPPTLYGVPVLDATHDGFQRWLSLVKCIPANEKYQPARRSELMREYFAAADREEVEA